MKYRPNLPRTTVIKVILKSYVILTGRSSSNQYPYHVMACWRIGQRY